MNESAIVAQLKSGALIPDAIGGWSSKTILAAAVILLFLKKKKR